MFGLTSIDPRDRQTRQRQRLDALASRGPSRYSAVARGSPFGGGGGPGGHQSSSDCEQDEPESIPFIPFIGAEALDAVSPFSPLPCDAMLDSSAPSAATNAEVDGANEPEADGISHHPSDLKPLHREQEPRDVDEGGDGRKAPLDHRDGAVNDCLDLTSVVADDPSGASPPPPSASRRTTELFAYLPPTHQDVVGGATKFTTGAASSLSPSEVAEYKARARATYRSESSTKFTKGAHTFTPEEVAMYKAKAKAQFERSQLEEESLPSNNSGGGGGDDDDDDDDVHSAPSYSSIPIPVDGDDEHTPSMLYSDRGGEARPSTWQLAISKRVSHHHRSVSDGTRDDSATNKKNFLSARGHSKVKLGSILKRSSGRHEPDAAVVHVTQNPLLALRASHAEMFAFLEQELSDIIYQWEGYIALGGRMLPCTPEAKERYKKAMIRHYHIQQREEHLKAPRERTHRAADSNSSMINSSDDIKSTSEAALAVEQLATELARSVIDASESKADEECSSLCRSVTTGGTPEDVGLTLSAEQQAEKLMEDLEDLFCGYAPPRDSLSIKVLRMRKSSSLDHSTDVESIDGGDAVTDDPSAPPSSSTPPPSPPPPMDPSTVEPVARSPPASVGDEPHLSPSLAAATRAAHASGANEEIISQIQANRKRREERERARQARKERREAQKVAMARKQPTI